MSGEAPAEKPLVPAYIERREKCPRYTFGGGDWIILAGAARTSGHIANLESIFNRDGGLPPHTRTRETEFAYVIAGRVRVRLGSEKLTFAEAGALIYIPPGVARQLTADEDNTRVYYGLVPAGAEEWIIRGGSAVDPSNTSLISPAIDADLAASFGILVHSG